MTLDRQRATATLGAVQADVENVELILDRTWSPYGQGSVTIAGLFPDLDPDAEPEPRFRLRIEQRFYHGKTADEIAALLAPATAATIAGAAWAGLTADEAAALYRQDLNADPIATRAVSADLMIREVSLDLDRKVTVVTVATDDAKLWDAALVDTVPEAFASTSVRAIVVIMLARVGAALAPGTADGTLAAPPIINPGQSYRDFLTPLLQQAGLRLYADERRVWRLVGVDELDPATVSLSTFRDVSGARPSIDRERGGYDSVVIEYRWTTVAGATMTKFDVAGPPRPRKTMKYTYDDTPYPGPGAAAQVLARLRRRRREIPVDAAANYDARPGMSVVFTSAALAQQSGRLARVVFGFPARVMRADLYDLEEISPRSTRAIPPGIKTNQLPGHTNQLNPGEL